MGRNVGIMMGHDKPPLKKTSLPEGVIRRNVSGGVCHAVKLDEGLLHPDGEIDQEA